jgi:elongation factor Ts
MSLRRAAGLSVGKGVIASYVHNAVSDGLGRIGVIVALESAGKDDELKAFGRMVAMHVASANPQAIDPSGLDAAAIEREKAVLADKAKAQGKPTNVIDKIVESGLKTFYKEVCLLDQGFIFDDKKSVAQAIKEAEATVGAPIKSLDLYVLASARESNAQAAILEARSLLLPVRTDCRRHLL